MLLSTEHCVTDETTLASIEKRGFLGCISIDTNSRHRWCTNNPRSIMDFMLGFNKKPAFVVITLDDPLAKIYGHLGTGATEQFLTQALYQARKRHSIS